MSLYNVYGCLGTIVGSYDSTDECMVAVLKQVTMADSTAKKYQASIAKLKPGGIAFKDVLGTRIVVERIK